MVEEVDEARGMVVLRGADLVDGTPIIDIKPFLPGASTSTSTSACAGVGAGACAGTGAGAGTQALPEY